MHVANNLFSSFVPLDLAVTFDDPVLVISLTSTVVIYMLLNILCIKASHSHWGSAMEPIDNRYMNVLYHEF